MVKKILTILLVIYLTNSYSQIDRQNLWWLRTIENKKYEENYKYAISSIENGILKQEIKKFINKNLICKKNKNEVAIIVKVILVNNNVKKYKIYYESNYFSNEISNIPQHFGIIDNRIIFFFNPTLKIIKIPKNIIFAIMRVRYPEICEKLNQYAKEYEKNGDEITPTMLGVIEHNIPCWYLTIKNEELVEKKMVFE